MMKPAYILLLFLLMPLCSAAQVEEQGRFRNDYNVVAYYEVAEDKWTDWKQGETTFILNYNSNSDIKVFYPNGKQELLRKISPIENGKTDDGEEYQSLRVLDGEGIEATFQLFANKKVGVIIRYSNIHIQFAEQ